MSQSRFSGGSAAQSGGSGFSNTTTSGSTSIQLKKLTLKTAAGKLIVSPDEINFKITGADGQFYDSKYKGDSITLPVSSAFDNTSAASASSLVIDKQGLSVPLFDLSFGDSNIPSGYTHNPYTRSITMGTNGLNIPFTDVLLGTLGKTDPLQTPLHTYTRTNAFLTGGTMFCPDISELNPSITSHSTGNTFNLADDGKRPQFTDTDGGGEPGTIYINKLVLNITADGFNTSATIESVNIYSTGSKLTAGDRIKISNSELLSKLGLNATTRDYFRSIVFSIAETEFTETTSVMMVATNPVFTLSQNSFSTTVEAGGSSGTGLTVRITINANGSNPASILRIVPYAVGSGYSVGDVIVVSQSEIEADPRFQNVTGDVKFTILTTDFPSRAKLSGTQLEFVISANDVATSPQYKVRDFTMAAGTGLAFPVDIDSTISTTSKRKEIATINSDGYFIPRKYSDPSTENNIEYFRITPNGLFGPGATTNNQNENLQIGGKWYLNSSSGNSLLNIVTAEGFVGPISQSSQPGITALANLSTFGAQQPDSGATCSGNLTVAGNLNATVNTGNQPNILTLPGLTTVGANSNTLLAAGNVTVSGTLTINGSFAMGEGANLVAGNISGTITRETQPEIQILAGLTSFGTSGVTTFCEGNVKTNSGTGFFGGGITGACQTASHPSITTLGGLNSLGTSGQVTNALGHFNVGGNISANLGIVTGATIAGTNITGNIATAAQNSITTMAGLTSIGNTTNPTVFPGNINVTGQVSAGSMSITGGVNATITRTSQPNITHLAGLTSFGASNQNVSSQGHLYVNQTLQAGNGGNIGSSTAFTLVRSTTLEGTISANTHSQPNISTIGNSPGNIGAVECTAGTGIVLRGPVTISGDFVVTGTTTSGVPSTTPNIFFNAANGLLHSNNSTNGAGLKIGSDQGSSIEWYTGSGGYWLFSHSINAGSKRITSVANPSLGTDAVNRNHLTQNYHTAATSDAKYISRTSSNTIPYSLNLLGGSITNIRTSGNTMSPAVNTSYLTTQLGGYVRKSYANTMTANLHFSSGTITGIPNPPGISSTSHYVANQAYVDTAVSTSIKNTSNYLNGTGFNSDLNMNYNNIWALDTPTQAHHATNKSYVDNALNNLLSKFSPAPLGDINMGKTSTFAGYKITNLKGPTVDDDAASKAYVDTQVATRPSTSALDSTYLKLDGTNITSDISVANRKITNLSAPTQNAHAANKQYVDDAIAGGISGIDDTTRRLNALTGRVAIGENLSSEIDKNNSIRFNSINGELAKVRKIADNEERLDSLEDTLNMRINTMQGNVGIRFDDHQDRLTIVENRDPQTLNSLRGDIVVNKREVEELEIETTKRINSLRGETLRTLNELEQLDRMNTVEGKLNITSLTVYSTEQEVLSLQTLTASNLQKINTNIQNIETLELVTTKQNNEIHGTLVSHKNKLDLLEFLTEKRMNTIEGKLLNTDSDDIHFRLNSIEGKIWLMSESDNSLELRINTIEGKFTQLTADEITPRLNSIEGQIRSLNNFEPQELNARINTLEGSFNIKLDDHETRINIIDTKFDNRINTLEGKIISSVTDSNETLINTVRGDFNIKITDHEIRLNSLDTKFDNRINTINGSFVIKLEDHETRINALDTKFDSRINSIEGRLMFNPTEEITPRINSIEGQLRSLNMFDTNEIKARINTLEGSFSIKLDDHETRINLIDTKFDSRINTLEGKIIASTDSAENPRFNTIQANIISESTRAQNEETLIYSRLNTLEGALVNKTTADTEGTETLEKKRDIITNSIRGELNTKIRELQEENLENNTRITTIEGTLAMKEGGGGAEENHEHAADSKLAGTDAFTSGTAATDINTELSAGMEMSTAISKLDFWLFSYLFDKPPAVTSVTATSYPTYVDIQWTNPPQLQAAFMNVKLPHIVNIVLEIQVQNQNTFTQVVNSPISNQTNRAHLYLTSSAVNESSGATYVKKVLQTNTNYNLRIYADNLSDRNLNYYSHGTLIATLSIGIPSLVRNLSLSSANASTITIIFTNPERFNTNLGSAGTPNNEPNLDTFAITWSPTGLATPGNRYNAQDNYSTSGSYNLNASVQTQNGTHTRTLSNSLPPNYTFSVSVKVKNVENTTGGTNNDGYCDVTTSSFSTADLANTTSSLGNITVAGNQYSGRGLNDASYTNIFSSKPTSINNIPYFKINNTIGTQSTGITQIKSYIGVGAPGASDWVALGNFDGFPVKGYSTFSNANISATPSVSDQETDQYKTGYWLKAQLTNLNFDNGLTINEKTTYTVGIQQTIGGSAISRTDTFMYETGLQQAVAGNMYVHQITGATIFRYISGIPMISSGTSWGFAVNLQNAARHFFPSNRRLFTIRIKNGGSNVGNAIYLNSNTSTFYEITDLTDNKSSTTYTVPNDGSPFAEFVQFQSSITFSPGNALYESLVVQGIPTTIWNTYNGGSNTPVTGDYDTAGLNLRSDQKSYSILTSWNASSKGTWYQITADPHSLSGLASSGNVATYDHDDAGFFRNDDRNLHMYNGELRFPATNNYTGYYLPSYNWGSHANTDFNYTSMTGGRTAMYTALNNNSSASGTYRYALFRYQNVLNNQDRTSNLNIVFHGITDSAGSSSGYVNNPKTSGVTPFNIVNNLEVFIKLDGTISGGKVGGTAAESGWWDVNHGALNLAYQFGNITNHIGTGNSGGVCQAASYSSGNLNLEAKFPADTVADVWVMVGCTTTVAFDYVSIS